jgi:L-rhamnose-H+ transport protein
MTGEITGLTLLVLAGAMNACFALPMKLMPRWAWENIWLVWSGFALVLLPLFVVLSFVPSLADALVAGGANVLLLVAVCGFAWGIAQVLFGLAIEMIGVTLAFSIVLGLSAAVGSIVPFVRIAMHRGFSSTDLSFAGSLALVLLGVLFCASAGKIRERSKQEAGRVDTSSNFTRGLICAICSGLGAAAMNIGFSLGAPIDSAAKAHGASAALSNTAVWFPLLEAGAVPNLVYCGILLRRNRTFGRFTLESTGLYWFGGLLMAILWFAGAVLYGVGAGRMGRFGTALGWPSYMASIVITAGLLGVGTGEWRHAPRRAFIWQTIGMLILVLSILLLAQSSGKM